VASEGEAECGGGGDGEEDEVDMRFGSLWCTGEGARRWIRRREGRGGGAGRSKK
jgi:hypothetical protein